MIPAPSPQRVTRIPWRVTDNEYEEDTAHDFSLFGFDLEASKKYSAKVRLIITNPIKDQDDFFRQVDRYYEDFLNYSRG